MKKQLMAVSSLTGVTQLIAFAKLYLISRIFGLNAELDGYYLALILPSFTTGIISAVLQTGLFPVRAVLKAKGNENELAAFERSTLLSVILLGSGMAALMAFGTPWLPKFIAPQAASQVQSALEYSLPFCSIVLVANVVIDCVGFLLAMRDRFYLAALAPIINGVLGVLILAVWSDGKLLALLTSTVVGITFQLIFCVWGLGRTRFVFRGELLTLRSLIGYWRKMLILGGWVLPGAFFSNLVSSLPQLWVTQYGDGAVSAFGYAYRFHSVATQVLVLAGAPVILSHFSDYVAMRNYAGIRDSVFKITVAALLVGACCIIVVRNFGALGLEWIFAGRFDVFSAERVASHWFWLTLGLPFSILGNVFAKLWQAEQKPFFLSGIAAVCLCAVYIVHSVTQPFLFEYASAAALSLSALVAPLCGIIYCFYSRKNI